MPFCSRQRPVVATNENVGLDLANVTTWSWTQALEYIRHLSRELSCSLASCFASPSTWHSRCQLEKAKGTLSAQQEVVVPTDDVSGCVDERELSRHTFVDTGR
jgi:hypothetical protein